MRSNPIIKDLTFFLQSQFAGRKYFACIYGSYAYGKHNKKSDLDLFIAFEDYSKKDFQKIKNFIVDLHIKNGLSLDNEVPYENKLLIKYIDLERAAFLGGLTLKNNRFVIPKVVKNKSFLNSAKIKKRLVLNALTSPHIFVGNDSVFYNRIKNIAERNLVLLAIDIIDKNDFTIIDLMKKLYISSGGSEEELYLGYKNYNKVKKYLKNILIKEIKLLVKKGRIIKIDTIISDVHPETLKILKNVFQKYENK